MVLLKPGADGQCVTINTITEGPRVSMNTISGVSSFYPQKHVDIAQIVARVSLNTG